MSSEKKIRAIFVLEMIGRPPEHLVESMGNTIKIIEGVPGVIIKEKKIFDAKLLKDEKNLYSTFAEIDAIFDDFAKLAEVVFTFIPSHIEIIEPEEMRVRNTDIAGIIEVVIRRLHQFDEVAKILSVQKSILEEKLSNYEKNPPQKDVKKKSKKKSKN